MITEDSKHSGSLISIGETELAKRNGFTRELKPQSYSLNVKNKDLFIRGGFPGPLNGVLCFLEQDLGCRWYAEAYNIKGHPEPGLQIIPDLSGKNLKVTPREFTPPFIMRAMGYRYGTRATDYGVLYFRQSPISWSSFMPKESGGRLNSARYFIHTYATLVPTKKYYKDHPEYFALQNGKRVKQTSTYGTVCYSNPDVPKIMAEAIRAEIRTSPETRFFSVSVNDNAYNFCECPDCDPVIKKIGPHGMQVLLANKVAELLCKDYPEILITTLVYGSGRLRTGAVKAHPNVVLFLAPIGARWNNVKMLIPIHQNPIIVEAIQECQKSSDRIFFWDYIDSTSYPFPNFDQVQATLRYLAKLKIEGYIADVTRDGRALTPLKKWLFSQLLWDTNADMDALISEFVSAYYGKTAPEISEYIKLMRHAWRNFKAESDKKGGEGVVFAYTANEKNTMRKLLDSALKKAKGDDVLTGRIAREYLPFLVMELSENPKYCGVEKYCADYELAERLMAYIPRDHFIYKEKLNTRWKNKLDWAAKKPDPNIYSPNTVVVTKAVVAVNGGPHDDPEALDGKALRHRGKPPWGVQWYYSYFNDYLIPGKTYVMRIRVRAQCRKPQTSGGMFDLRAFHHGNDALNRKQPILHAVFTPEDAKGKYRWAVLGKVKFQNLSVTGMFWMNSLIEKEDVLWYDQMDLIPIEEYREKTPVPDKTIVL